jgi:tetratricopeptide (TPR) repeat protein
MAAGETRCAACGRRWWEVSRESLLMAGFIAAAVVLFVLTSFAARLFHAHHDALGEEWYEKGKAALAGGDTEGAIRALRNALLYDRDSFPYRMLLAQALLRGDHGEEARSYLRTLWQREPGHGVINLELARFAAARGQQEEAMRYYQNAIHGLWPEDAAERRLQARLELSRFLLDRELKEEARAQIMALAAEMPRRAGLHVVAGGLFLRAGDSEQALAQYEAALAEDGTDARALLGAGQAAFHSGNYTAARRYLREATAAGAGADAAGLLQTTELIFETDPFRWRLGSQERIRRTVQAFERSLERLRACAAERGVALEGDVPDTELALLYQRARERRPHATLRELRRNPDMVEIVMDFAFEVQRVAARHCGMPQDADLALLLMAQQREAAER